MKKYDLIKLSILTGFVAFGLTFMFNYIFTPVPVKTVTTKDTTVVIKEIIPDNAKVDTISYWLVGFHCEYYGLHSDGSFTVSSDGGMPYDTALQRVISEADCGTTKNAPKSNYTITSISKITEWDYLHHFQGQKNISSIRKPCKEIPPLYFQSDSINILHPIGEFDSIR